MSIPNRLPPSEMPSAEQIAEIKDEAGGVPIYMIRNPIAGWFGFKHPKLEAITRVLLAKEGAEEGENKNFVRHHCVYPPDARKRFVERPAIVGRLAVDLKGKLGGKVGVQDILEDELTDAQADMIVKNHDRALALRAIDGDLEIDFVFAEPRDAQVSAMRRNISNLSAAADHLREITLLGDIERLIAERPFAVEALTIRILNLVGADEAVEAKKF